MKKILEKYDIFDELIDGLDNGIEAFLENLIQDRVSIALEAKNEQYQKLTKTKYDNQKLSLIWWEWKYGRIYKNIFII